MKRKEEYQKDEKSDNYYAQAKKLADLKKKKDIIWLKKVNNQTLQFVLRTFILLM